MLFLISFSSKISPAFNSDDVLPETLFTSLLKPLFFLVLLQVLGTLSLFLVWFCLLLLFPKRGCMLRLRLKHYALVLRAPQISQFQQITSQYVTFKYLQSPRKTGINCHFSNTQWALWVVMAMDSAQGWLLSWHQQLFDFITYSCIRHPILSVSVFHF